MGMPFQGTAAVNADQTVTITPTAGFSGTLYLNYTVADSQGRTATASLDLTVVAPAFPVAGNVSASTTANTPVTINVLANDSSPEGYPLAVTSVTGYMGSAISETGVINPDNTITYTPPADFTGTTWLWYTISDGQGGTAQALVTISVSA